MGFLPANFQLLAPFHSRLKIRHGTDRHRRTDNGHQRLMPPSYGGGGTVTPHTRQSKNTSLISLSAGKNSWSRDHICSTSQPVQSTSIDLPHVCMKFVQLILRKIIKIVATRCQILRLKCTKYGCCGAGEEVKSFCRQTHTQHCLRCDGEGWENEVS